MNKYKTVIKLISADFTVVRDGHYGKVEERINSKKSLKKIIKLCLKNDLPFQVSIRDTQLINNMNYIEIYNSKMWINRDRYLLKEVLA